MQLLTRQTVLVNIKMTSTVFYIIFIEMIYAVYILKTKFGGEIHMKKLLIFICTVALLIRGMPGDVSEAADDISMGLYESCDCSTYFYGLKNPKYESSNPGVIKIINNQMLAVSVGKVTVTAVDGKKKIKKKVSVKNIQSYFALNSVSVSLYVGETYVLNTAGMVSKVAYKSRNASIASVGSDGKITAKSPGTTYIEVKSGTMKNICAVTVIDKANKSEVISFKEDADTTYVAKWKFKNKSKYILAVQPQTYLPKAFETKLDKMITQIEKTSGMKMHAKKPSLKATCDKPVIWVGGRTSTLADSSKIYINAADMTLKNESAKMVGKWIANCIISRNSTYTGGIFGNFYGESIAGHALKGTSFVETNYNIVLDKFETNDPQWSKITVSQMEKYLTTQNLQSDSKEYFPEYLYKTYGKSAINKIITKINAENKKKGIVYAGGSGISAKRCLAICKSYTSADVVKDYVKYFKSHAVYSNGPSEDIAKYSAKNDEIIKISASGYGRAEYCDYAATNYTGSVIYDFTEAMKYFTINCGQKVTGIYGVGFVCGDGDATIEIYDRNDKLLNTVTGHGSIDVYQDGAVKVKVSGTKGYNGFICYSYITNFSKFATQMQEY